MQGDGRLMPGSCCCKQSVGQWLVCGLSVWQASACSGWLQLSSRCPDFCVLCAVFVLVLS